MRFLADENFPGDAVRMMQAEGYDVVWVRTHAPGIPDEEVLHLAVTEQRVLLTFDKDFGGLAYHARLPASCGVVLFRLPMETSEAGVRRVMQALASRTDWTGRFWVIEERRVRMRPLPSASRS